MNNQEYETKKRECLRDFCKEHGFIETADVKGIFGYAFDRAYAIGKQKETITQEAVEKAAIEYVLTRQQARHNAKKEEDATMRDFDKTIKAWDTYDMEQAFESGANLFLGKQEKDTEEAVISGWVARDGSGSLNVFNEEPTRDEELEMWSDGLDHFGLPYSSFPDLTWESDPLPVEIIIKRKKNG